MAETEDDGDPLSINNNNSSGTDTSRSRPTTRWSNDTSTTKIPYFFIPKRPQVVKMRDLSPDTKDRLYREYYDVYDPWTGIRIAATLGILISLFTLFLIYKGRYNKSRTTIVASKKPSLYLYDEDLDCDLGNLGSSDDSGSFGYPFRYDDTRLQKEFPFGIGKDEYPLEEVFVKSSVVECVALTVHKNQKGAKGPKYGTLRIKEDASRSLPCSPYEQKRKKSSTNQDGDETDAKSPCSPTSSQEGECNSVFGSITSFTSSEVSNEARPKVFSKPKSKSQKVDVGAKSAKKSDSQQNNDCDGAYEDTTPSNTVVVASKRPQDYRSRSTVVTIGRRKKKS